MFAVALQIVSLRRDVPLQHCHQLDGANLVFIATYPDLRSDNRQLPEPTDCVLLQHHAGNSIALEAVSKYLGIHQGGGVVDGFHRQGSDGFTAHGHRPGAAPVGFSSLQAPRRVAMPS